MSQNYEISSILTELPLCKQLLQKHYSDYSTISLRKYKLDPFFSNDEILKNLYDWYISKNPDFLPMHIVNPQMPEYEVLIAGILKDFYLVLEKISNNYSSLNNIKDILKMIEKVINEGYIYTDSIKCIYKYLILFNNMLNSTLVINKYNKDCEILLDFIESPYIFYPSFHQIDIYKVNLTIAAPFLNFLLSNKIHQSHGSNVSCCYELFHDIDFHYNLISMKFFKDLFKIEDKNKYMNTKHFIENINENKDIFKEYFNFNNFIIQKLKDKLIYKRTKNNSFNTYKIKKNYMNSIILFLIFHESYFYTRLFSATVYIKTYIKLQNYNKLRLIEYFRLFFYKICIDNLLGSTNSIKKYIYNSNTNKLKIINSDFIEIVENNYKIKLTNDNINEIIELYKEGVIDIYNTVFDL